jgi:serine phosphatase RsbU (regulator of sigma subunit)
LGGLNVAGTEDDAAGIVAALASQVIEPLRAEALAVWVLRADGSLRLLGAAGAPGPEAADRPQTLSADSPQQRVARGEPDQWWPDGPPDDTTDGRSGAQAVLGLTGRSGALSGVLEVRWAEPLSEGAELIRSALGDLAVGCAEVLGTHRELPETEVFEILDQLAGPVLVVRGVRSPSGLADFAIVHVSAGYRDPAGREPGHLTGLKLRTAYPDPAPLSALARAVVTAGPAPGEPVPGGPAVARFFDGAVFSWRAEGEPGRLAALLDNAQRVGRIGGWEEDLGAGAVYWTESVFRLFGLLPGQPIGLADLHNYVIAADRPAIAGFREALLGGAEAITASFRIVRPDDGSVRQMLVFAEPVRDAAGTVMTVRGAYQDVSAQHHTQVALAATRDRLADTEQRAAEEHRLALQLQRAIMPPDEPPVAASGVQVAVRYRPAGPGQLVGGDWYDTLLLPTGDMLLVVGDVAGHGIDAVTGMVAVRNALRGLAVTGKGPGELLALLNSMVCHLVAGVVGTVVCGLYNPESKVLRWARAGHLPPVLVRGDDAAPLQLPSGLLLGMDGDAEYEEVESSLQTGDVLLLFTDGLIERRADSITDALTGFAAMAAPAGPSADAHADRLLAAAVSDTDDDACLVAVRIR